APPAALPTRAVHGVLRPDVPVHVRGAAGTLPPLRDCVLYTIKVSVKKARVSWSHRRSGRFLPERRGMTFPIPLCRADEHDQVEQVVHRSGEPGEPDRPGILPGIVDAEYYLIEYYRERNVIHKEGSAASWVEVAVIRGLPGGRGITVTSHVPDLVVRLHDTLFSLGGGGATVDLHFSEHWFRLPSGWKEERLYAEDGILIIDIAAPVENLVRKLYQMRVQEDKEMERRSSETEEERARRLQEEEAIRKREEEERMRIYERNEEKRRRVLAAAAAAKPSARAPPVWDAALWDLAEVQPASAHWYSKFELSMNSNKQVSCKCVGQESLQAMLRRVDDGESVLPISKMRAFTVDHDTYEKSSSKIVPSLASSSSSSSRSLETLGFVQGYSDLQTWGATRKVISSRVGSGRTQSNLLMVSRSAAKVLTLGVFVDKLDILLDDGMVVSGLYDCCVDVHCDDVSASELLKTDWSYHILCKNVDGDGKIAFSTLLVKLKKKLQLQLSKAEESLMESISEMEDEEETGDLAEEMRRQMEWVWVPRKPNDLEEVELQDCSMLKSLGF
ncbi:hypothetical protein EJB05_45993, partial [Eragrostis curvula]